jgi:deoxyribodipyrimidine photo-lyase
LRDSAVKTELHGRGIQAESFNANLLYEPWTIANKQGKPFQVFTPFWKACLASREPSSPLPIPLRLNGFHKPIPSVPLDELSLLPSIPLDAGIQKLWRPGEEEAHQRLGEFLEEGIVNYSEQRNFPALEWGVSHLSPSLHFGEISPRIIWQAAKQKYGDNPAIEPYLRQLGWREFAHHLLFHFPHTPEIPLRKDFESFGWKTDLKGLEAWQKGLTGYPLVDAGMRELWATGWMHNRVRMVVGSFLVKDLLISWTEGARWFWDTLVDADLPNNTLGWQWIGGCGADAAPYFRIFHPVTQSEKFDPEGDYIKKWVPELARVPLPWIHKPWEAPSLILLQAGVTLGKTYPYPIVDHKTAREEALAAFGAR